MRTTSSKSRLSLSRQQLLTHFQKLNFGRIEQLHIRNGEPVLSPLPRINREFKPGSDNDPRLEINTPDYLLKVQVVDLFGYFDRMQNGTIDVIEIKHGLPSKLEHAESAS